MGDESTSSKPVRDWHFGDEPCPLGACELPFRTHTHYSHGPGDPFHVVFYDDPEWGPRNMAADQSP